jgi:hypothetical protein
MPDNVGRLAFLFILILAAAGPVSPGASELPLLTVEKFALGRADGWRLSDPAHWRVAGEPGDRRLELTAPGAPGKIRAPSAWAVLAAYDVSEFVFSGRVRCDADPANLRRDMDIIFYFRDPAHFGYVHFAASSDAVHNIIGWVDGADRVKVNIEPAGSSGARLRDRKWHAFKVAAAADGRIEAFLDDMTVPVLTAKRPAAGRGLVGVGSFDDTGAFADLKLWGK